MRSMAYAADPEPSARFFALASVVFLHLLAFALLLYHRGAAHLPLPAMGTLKVVALNAEPAAKTAPPPPVLPSKIGEVVELETPLSFSTETDADAVTASAGGCLVLERISDAILADPAALASVLNAPAQTRSIAGAIVLWNVHWSESATAIVAPLGATRAAVERSLASLDQGCLDEPIAGPRLIPIPAGSGTLFVVFGSGNWTWRQVVEGAPAATVAMDATLPVDEQ